MTLKVLFYTLSASILVHWAHPAPCDKHSSSTENHQTRFNKLRLFVQTEGHNRFLYMLEDTKQMVTKTSKLEANLDNKGGEYTDLKSQMANFLKTTENFQTLDHTIGMSLVAEYINGVVLGEDKRAALEKYGAETVKAVRTTVSLLSYLEIHCKELPEEFSFIEGDIKALRMKWNKRYEQFEEQLKIKLERFVSSLSEEGREIHANLVEMYDRYRSEEDINIRWRGVAKFFSLNLNKNTGNND